MPRSFERKFPFFFFSYPISKISRLTAREAACHLMKTQRVELVIDGHTQSARTPNSADTAGASGQYPTHTMLFITPLFWITINSTLTQSNEAAPSEILDLKVVPERPSMFWMCLISALICQLFIRSSLICGNYHSVNSAVRYSASMRFLRTKPEHGH